VSDSPSSPKPSLIPLVLTVFIDLLGFAMFLPDLQLRGEGLVKQLLGANASTLAIGLLVGFGQSIYSIAQLATGTWLGRYSDINGRRPVLIISAALSVVAYIIYAHAGNIFLLYFSRVLSGIAAANLGVAFAYVADISPPEKRSANLGALGAAFGLGFVIGPALGAFLLKQGNDSPVLLGYTTAVLCLINLVLTYLFVKESNFNRLAAGKASFIANLRTALKVPGLSVLLLMFFMMNLSFTNLEATFFRLLAEPNWIFKVPTEQVKMFGAIILVVVGITGAVTQGGLVRVIVPKLGELNTVRYFYTAFIPVFISIPFFPFYFPGIIGTILLGLTNGLSGPSMNSLVSQRAPREMQGSILGLTQSLGSLARVVGPMFANFLFGVKPYYPYLWGGLLSLIPAVLAWTILKPMAKTEGDEMPTGMAH
jgi:MFS transporter, DHA1 family, tetracycline resistance protein